MSYENKQKESLEIDKNNSISSSSTKHKRSIWWGLVIFIIIVLGAFYIVNMYNNARHTKLSKEDTEICLSKNGEVAINWVGPNISREYCLPSDVGNECVQNSDCEGECVINQYDIENLQYNKAGFIIGTCAFYPDGCYSDYIIKYATKNKEDLEQHQGICF